MTQHEKLSSNKTFNKNEIKKLIEWFLTNYGTIRTSKLLDKLKHIGFKYTTIAGISIGLEDLDIPVTKRHLFENTENELFKSGKRLEKGKISTLENSEKIIKSWNTTNELLKRDIINNFREKDLLNPVYMMTFSGARGNISQIRQLIGMRGLMSDSKGEIINLPIKSNLKEGLKITEYFISCYGARKGLVDTALKTANSGYLTRRLIYVTQNQIIEQANCGTKRGFKIQIKKNKNSYNDIKNRIIGKVISKNLLDTTTNKILASTGQDICNYLARKIIKSSDIKIIHLRSSLLCKLNRGICQLCYGWNLGNGRMVELGESVGIIAAQSIGEPGTQLTMRTFHTGGVFSGEVKETLVSPQEGIIYYDISKDGKIIQTKYGEKAFLTSKKKVIKISNYTKKVSKINVPQNSLIFIKPGRKVLFKQIIAEIQSLNIQIPNLNKTYFEAKEINTNLSGETYFENIIIKKGNSLPIKKQKGLIWILSGNIITDNLLTTKLFKAPFNKSKMQYNVDKTIKTKTPWKKVTKQSIKLSLQKLKVLKNFNKKTTAQNKQNTYKVLKINNLERKILLNKQKTECFLKSNKKDLRLGEFLFLNEKMMKKYKNKYNCQLTQITQNTILTKKANAYVFSKESKINIKNNDLIKKGNVLLQTFQKKQKTEDIVQGLPKIEELLEVKKSQKEKAEKEMPTEVLKRIFDKLSIKYKNKLATRKSIKKIQRFLINKIQSVYEKQGVRISDKHMEIIVKQMTSKTIINKPGDSNFITGETVELNRIEKLNTTLKNKATYEPILVGISKFSLSNQSFISEASFQETTRILTRSAIEGKIDWLYGLKENIVLGNLIPAGTGYKKL